MKTAELTGALLDYWVARAEGLEAEVRKYEMADGWHHYCNVRPANRPFNPSANWAQGGALVAKYRVGFGIYEPGERAYFACTGLNDVAGDGHGPDHLTAACRAIVASKFGSEVPTKSSTDQSGAMADTQGEKA